jgi:hypothetical protein
MQSPCVMLILPHASADTSNTDSNLKEGVLYGFFAAEAATSRALSLLVLSLLKYCTPYIKTNPSQAA